MALTEEPIPAAEVDREDYPHLNDGAGPGTPDPSEELSDTELQVIADDLREQFPHLVVGNDGDASEEGYIQIDVVLVTDELEAYAAQQYPDGTYVLAPQMQPVL